MFEAGRELAWYWIELCECGQDGFGEGVGGYLAGEPDMGLRAEEIGESGAARSGDNRESASSGFKECVRNSFKSR